MIPLLLIALATAGEPQLLQPGWAVDHWTTADGLPIDHMGNLLVDRDGTLWIASLDGLVHFDGREFEVLRGGEPSGPPTSRVMFVSQHPVDGALWLVDELGTLQRRSGAEVRTFTEPEQRALAQITRGQDTLWVLTALGPTRLEREPEPVPGPDGVQALFLVEAPDGLWLVDLERRLWRQHPKGGWERMGAEPVDHPLLVRDTRTGYPGVLGDPVKRWSPEEGALVPDLSPSYQGVGTPPRPDRWGDCVGGVCLDGTRVVDGVVLTDLASDGEALWWTSPEQGLYRVRPSPLSTLRPPTGEAANIQRLWWDSEQQTLWAQAADQGWWAVHFTGQAPGTLPEPPGVPDDSCAPWTRQHLLGVGGERWFACRHQVFRLSAEGWVEDGPPDRAESGPGWLTRQGLWLGGARSAVAVRSEGRWRLVPLGEGVLRDVFALVELEDGAVLLGGYEGLFRVSAAGAPAERLDGSDPLGSVRHLRVEGPTLWISTVDRGLCALPLSEPRAAPRCLGAASTLGRATVHASLSDGRGHTWVSSNQGLGVTTTEGLQAWASGGEQPGFVWLGQADGMRSAEGNGFLGDGAVATPDGLLWFATQDGVVRVDPERLTLAPPTPILHPSQQPSSADGPLELPTTHPALRLSWSTGAVPWAEQVEFRYRLGEDQAWSAPTRERSVELLTLRPGSQRFEVQARLGGPWSAPSHLEIVRAPALHERGFFPALLALAGLATLSSLVVARSVVQTRRNRALQARVDEQTRWLVEKNEVLESQKQRLAEQARHLAELDAVKRQLIANVSHELRTPLSLIMAPLGSLAAEATPGSRTSRHLQLATDGVKRLNELVDQLFDLARIQAGGLQLGVQRVDLRRPLQAAALRFEAAGQAVGVALELRLPPEPQPLWIDADLLDKVLNNLLSNALRHSPPGSTLRLALLPEEDHVRIIVEDEGPGVPPEHWEAIFERFTQWKGDTAKGGTGLGLALVRELVELHGGQVGVENGRLGARFWVELPRGAGHFSPDDIRLEEVQASPAPAATPPLADDVQGSRILLVEDHPQLRGYLAELLGERFTVVEAGDGVEALEQLERQDFDLLITDVTMPRMDGQELVAALRGRPGGQQMPVLFFTARGDLQDRLAGLSQGDDYLTKPFQAPELMARAAALLRRSRQGAREPALQREAQQAQQDQEDAQRFEAEMARVALPRLGEKGFNAGALAKAMAMSPRTLELRMRAHGLDTPGEWLRQRRLERAEQLLREGRFETVGEVAEAVGLSRPYFSRLYTAQRGRSPGGDLVPPSDV